MRGVLHVRQTCYCHKRDNITCIVFSRVLLCGAGGVDSDVSACLYPSVLLHFPASRLNAVEKKKRSRLFSSIFCPVLRILLFDAWIWMPLFPKQRLHSHICVRRGEKYYILSLLYLASFGNFGEVVEVGCG